jgi:nitrite reductase (NADH) large subunit
MDQPRTGRLVVVGGGMVAHRLVEALTDRDTEGSWQVDVFAEESRPPYDRVALTSFFSGRDPDDLLLGEPELWRRPGVRLHTNAAVQRIDTERREVHARGRTFAYDALVIATGSYPAVPPVPGSDLPGSFVYRTVDDVTELRAWATTRNLRRPVRGAVVGGGLLGLEAAGALTAMGVETTVVEFAERLMPIQVDQGGGEGLRRLIEKLGVSVRTSTATSKVRAGSNGRVNRMDFADGTKLPVDLVVFATGVRARDELARDAGLTVGERGGVVVDDGCATDAPGVYAIGEVACIDGRTWGLVAPGYTMAEVVVDRLLGGEATFPGADTSTKLKLLGVDVASFGDAFAQSPGALEVVYADPVAGAYKKLVLSDDAQTLLGGVLVGDASAYASLRPMVGQPLGADPTAWLLPEGAAPATATDLPDAANVCSCNNVSAGAIRSAVTDQGCTDLAGVKGCTKAGTSCGSCLPLVKKLVATELEKSGVAVSSALCEHFELSRAQLFDVVRVQELGTFSEIIDRHGSGRGCDICRPVVASILSSLGKGHVLDRDTARLQDTNDHVMANLQKDGTYSVVPRVPGGEITPQGLIDIGQVASDFGLYTKITGGQRIDLLGARLEQLPSIWQRLIDAGFESGHAYGKALRTVKSCVGSQWCRYGVQDSVALAIALELRTVKSCVGSQWCRYGVQDSVALAIALELRYRGLRSPHKIKLGVSGCARECAEARSKDVGVIATEQGWNVYVGGNGGFTPRHARLFAEDLSTDDLVRTIDRFLMFYVRTAERLQRTATWVEDYEGGLEAIADVVLGDSLDIGADLDEAMAAHVDGYVDEWAATLADPEKRAQFVSFVNAPDTQDEGVGGAIDNRGDLQGTIIAGPRLEVRR